MTRIPDGPAGAVEESRRLLREILSRRDFVHAAGTAVATIGGLGLIGCGSGAATTGTTPPPPPPPPSPPGTIPDGLKVVTGSVSLPAGSALKLTDLSVDVMTQTVPVTATGFTIGISPGGPSLALLLDGNGNGVLMSMFDPTSTNFAITTHSTAVSLLYYAISGYMFPDAAISQILALLGNDPAVAGLDAAIAHAVATDPRALANNAPGIGPALVQAVQTIIGASVRASAVSAPAAKLARSVPTLMTVNPTAAQNGVMVNQDDATTSLLLSNTKRRPCRVYVYQMAVDLPSGQAVPASLVAGPFDLDSTENLGLFTALKDFTTFFHGLSPWSPVNLAPIPVTLSPDTADQTTYTVVVLASALERGDIFNTDPAIYTDAHFAPFVSRWRTDTLQLLGWTLFGDILLPILCLLLGAGTIKVSRSVLAGVITAGAAAYTTTYNRVLNQLQYGSVGKLRAGLADIIQTAIRDQDYYTLMKTECQQVIGLVEAKALAAQTAAQQATRLTRAAEMFSKVMSPLLLVGAALEAVDLGAVLLDWVGSDMVSSWTALVIRQKLNLAPQNPRISSGDRQTFTVANPANTQGTTFEYDWMQTSLFATFSANGEVNVGNKITTTKRSVDLVTTGSDTTAISIVVIGYDTSKSPRQEIGRAGTTVNFLYPAEITPTNAALDPGQQRTFVVTVTGALPSNVQYRWTLNGTAGSIGAASVVTTSVPSIVYTAGNLTGNDSLRVDVIDPGGTLYAKASVGVGVVGPTSIQFTLAGPWDPTRQPPNGSYSYSTGDAVREPSPGGAGLDAIFLVYDVGAADATIGTLVTILVPTGSILHTGDTFTKFPPGSNGTTVNFQLTLSDHQSDPDNVDARQWAPDGTGTLKFDALNQALDGTWVLQYSFTITNAGGATIIGSGVGRWK